MSIHVPHWVSVTWALVVSAGRATGIQLHAWWPYIWKTSLTVAFVVFESIALYIALLFRIHEHDIAHQLAARAEESIIGKVLLKVFHYFKKTLIPFGIAIGEQAAVQQWAGLFHETDHNPYVLTAIRQEAFHLATLFPSVGPGKHIFLTGETGSGTRDVMQDLHRTVFSEDPRRKLFYFDCSAVPQADLHRRFLYNLCAWSEVFSLDTTSKELEQGSNMPLFELRWFFAQCRIAPRPIVVIIDIERLTDIGQGTEAYQQCRHALKTLLRAPRIHSIVSCHPGRAREFHNWYQLYWGRWTKRRRQTTTLRAFPGLARDTVESAIGEMCPALDHHTKVDDAVALLALVRTREPAAARELVKEFEAWKPDKVSERLLVLGQEVLETQGLSLHRIAIAALSVVEVCIPLSAIYTLFQSLGIPLHTRDGSLLPWREPGILESFIELGLVARHKPNEPVFSNDVYTVRPAFKELFKRELLSPEERTRLTLLANGIVEDLAAPGITPTSRYISQGDFRPLHGLIGYLRGQSPGKELEVPLPKEACEIVSVSRRGATLPSCTLRKYGWKDRSGRPHTDIVMLLSPAEMTSYGAICRVQVHIASQTGSGRAVQRALEPYVETTYDAEGDAYRFGPGGYMELLVRLKPSEDFLGGELLSKRTRRRIERARAAGDSASIVGIVEEQVRNVLRAGVDHRATVRLLLCTSADVIQDWTRLTEELTSDLEVRAYDTIDGVATTPYTLVIGSRALELIQQELKSSGSVVSIDEIQVQGFYSYIAYQVFFVFVALKMDTRVRAQILSTDPAESVHVTFRFMRVAERKMINLSSLRHGPEGWYIVDFELPHSVAPQTDAASCLIDELVKELDEEKVSITFLSGISNIIPSDDQDGRAATPNSVIFGEGTPVDPSKFDYVSNPGSFHRAMRKHLFIPDSDAAIVTTINQLADSKRRRALRILEIGSATGGLTEKLIQSGQTYIDTVDPDERLSKYWCDLRVRKYSNCGGAHFLMSLEGFVRSSTRQKYDVIVSQGLHHHIPNGVPGDKDYRKTFLQLCSQILVEGGIYILSDEFLMPYDNELDRRNNLDQWYRRVIAAALADGYTELADLEYGFWLSDRRCTAEYKESIEIFKQRLLTFGIGAPFTIESVTKFGLTREYGGGFGVIVMKKTSII